MNEENIKAVIDLLNQLPDFDGTVIEQIDSERNNQSVLQHEAIQMFCNGLGINPEDSDLYNAFDSVITNIGISQARTFWVSFISCSTQSKKLAMQLQHNRDAMATVRRIHGM